MQNTKNLRVAEHARRLGVAVYRLTAKFPAFEQFGLTSQMRRSAVSIGSNIAEGCGRRTNRELLAYRYIASGSANELEFQLQMAEDLDYGDATERSLLLKQAQVTRRMLSRLTAFLRSQPAWRNGPAPNRRASGKTL
jgi:four helix bundle protein